MSHFRADDVSTGVIDEARATAAKLLDAGVSDTSNGVVREWYEQLIDELPFSVFIKDPAGRYVVVNRRFVEFQQSIRPLTKERIIGAIPSDLVGHSVADAHAQADERVLDGETIRDWDVSIRRVDGTDQVFRVSKFPLRGDDGAIVGLIGISTEVTESTRVAKELAESERRYRLALRASRDGIWELDIASWTTTISPRCARMLHLPVSGDPMPSDSLFGYQRPGERQRVLDAIERLQTDPGQMMSVRCDIVLHDGEPRTVQLESAALTENGVVVRLIGSIADVTDAVENERRLEHLANHDHLTSLDNRRSLTMAIDRIIENDVCGAVLLYLDLNGFKLVNDSFGHPAGDEMLIAVGERLRDHVEPDDLVARLGGDEFAILLRPGVEGQDRASEITRAILDSFSEPFVIGGVETFASVSIGVLATEGYTNSDDLVRDADTAMYSAKKQRAPVSYFEPGMHQAASSLRKLHSDLRRANERNEFRLVYQPIVRAVTGSVVAVEALLRWMPAGTTTTLLPSTFLPALEETGLIVDVGNWVIEEACRQLAAWRAVDHLEGVRVSINLSRAQIHQIELASWISECLGRFGLRGSDVIFELTETAISTDTAQLLSVLQEIRALGAGVAIDDFGVGQSCLSQLHDLPIDQMKIDMSFVRRIHDGTVHDDPVLGAILGLSAALDKRTVAEGVETEDQATWLVAHGCEKLQGFFFDRPLTPLQVSEQIVDGRLTTSGVLASAATVDAT